MSNRMHIQRDKAKRKTRDENTNAKGLFNSESL